MSRLSPAVRQAMQSLQIDAVTAECSRAFADAGVPHLLLKGPTIASWLYGDGTTRPYCDSDLLVPSERLAEACAVLERLGFRDVQAGWRPSERTRHAVNYVRDRRAVDLHHTLALVPDGARVWEVFSRGRTTITLGGVEVPAPGHAARCVFLALHAAQHGRTEPQPLEDLARGLAQVPAAVWQRADALAEDLSCGPAYRLGRALVERVSLSTSEPEWREAPLEVRLRAERAAPGGISLVALGHLPRRARAAAAVRRTLPSRAWMRSQYGDTGLVAAYAARLQLIVRRLGPAVRDLRRARAGAPESR